MSGTCISKDAFKYINYNGSNLYDIQCLFDGCDPEDLPIIEGDKLMGGEFGFLMGKIKVGYYVVVDGLLTGSDIISECKYKVLTPSEFKKNFIFVFDQDISEITTIRKN